MDRRYSYLELELFERDLAAQQKLDSEQTVDEDEDTIEFEEDKQPPGFCFRCFAEAMCLPISTFYLIFGYRFLVTGDQFPLD